MFPPGDSVHPVPAPTIWNYLFLLFAYASAALCIYRALRLGWPEAGLELGIFLLFVVGYWLLESFATHAGNFYLYPEPILDPVPYWSGSSSFVGQAWQGPFNQGCPKLDHSAGISLSVLLMEASLTYTAMWTARLLAPGRALLWPFVVALAVLAVDVFLDPVVSTALDCLNKTKVGGGEGLRLWEWRVHPGLGIEWFGIPLFNYAAWFCVPIVAVALALLLRWGLLLLGWRPNVAGPLPTPRDALLLLIAAAFALLLFLSPLGKGAVPYKVYIMAGVLAASIAASVAFRRGYVHDHAHAWELILPAVLFCLYGMLALFFGGEMKLLSALFVGIACCVLCLWYWFSPYSES